MDFTKEQLTEMTKEQLIQCILDLQTPSNKISQVSDAETTLVTDGLLDIELYTDGSSIGNPGPGGAGFVAVSGSEIMEECSQNLGRCTNNFAEYSAVVAALEYYYDTVTHSNFKNVIVYTDSMLVVNQVNGVWKVKNKALLDLYSKVVSVKSDIQKVGKSVTFKHVKAHCGNVYNERADTLANTAARS